MKIYFCGSIRGGRQLQPFYKRIIETLQFYDNVVLSEHVGSEMLDDKGELKNAQTIFLRDIEWMTEADVVIAEVSVPSLGVGFEICYAQQVLKKPTLCITKYSKMTSAMIEGNPTLEFGRYFNEDDAIKTIVNWCRVKERKLK